MNKYLEKIASLSLVVPAAIGAASARKGDRVGGAVGGVVGGVAGGTAGAVSGAMIGKKFLENANHVVGPHTRGVKPGVYAGIAAGAYLGGKAYSKFKHRND